MQKSRVFNTEIFWYQASHSGLKVEAKLHLHDVKNELYVQNQGEGKNLLEM